MDVGPNLDIRTAIGSVRSYDANQENADRLTCQGWHGIAINQMQLDGSFHERFCGLPIRISAHFF
jgi:hypothetical protein